MGSTVTRCNRIFGGEALECIGGSDVLWSCVVELWSDSTLVLELYMPLVLLKLPRI